MPIPQEKLTTLFNKMDTNGDGKLSMIEFQSESPQPLQHPKPAGRLLFPHNIAQTRFCSEQQLSTAWPFCLAHRGDRAWADNEA